MNKKIWITTFSNYTINDYSHHQYANATYSCEKNDCM